MPTSSCFFVLSVTAGILAVILALSPPARFQFAFSDSGEVHCYRSVTPSAYENEAARCFAVTSNGTISNVWKVLNESDVPKGVVLQTGAAIPGLWDGHGHVLGFGDSLSIANLYSSANMDDVLARLKAFSENNPQAGSRGDWLRGSGWDQAAFGRMPTAGDLDDVFSGQYVMLSRVDAHCIWVSSAVLDLLPDPIPQVPGGEVIGRGVLCDSAMDMVFKKWPKASAAQTAQMMRSAMKELNKVGIVGVHEAGVTPATMEIYKQMVEEKEWTLRIYAMLECPVRNTFCPDAIDKFTRSDGLLSMRSVKLFSDGALGSWGSALLAPYDDRPESRGSLMINASTINSLTMSWAQAGYQVNIHAIGDRANQYVIDAFETALSDLEVCPDSGSDSHDVHSKKRECQLERRFRIEHTQIVSPADQRRLHQDLGILPSVQPTHATSDMAYAQKRLGEERLTSSAYRLRSLLYPRLNGDSGPNIILGSDFPVEPPAPLHGMYAAIARKNPQSRNGPPGDVASGFLASEALTLEEALAGFTTGPAWGGFMEGKAGEIAAGRWADWVVLDASLNEAGLDGLLDVKVLETWVAGRRVYKAD